VSFSFLAYAIDVSWAQTPEIRIVSIVSGKSSPYDQPLRVRIVVAQELNVSARSPPIVAVFYVPLLNGTDLIGGWRVAEAKLDYSWTGFGISVFTTEVPNPIYHESLPYGTKIVLYAEARDGLGNYTLSCRENYRWDPYAQEDKLVVLLEDPYPPKIGDLRHSPDAPTSDDSVFVTASVSDGLGSGVRRAELFYSLDGARTWITVAMSRVEKNVFGAGIPAQKRGLKVTYYVRAWDNAGNDEKSSQVKYEVLGSREEINQEQTRPWVMWLIASGVVFVIAAAIVLRYRRRLVEIVRGVARTRVRDKALTLTIALSLLLVARACYWLYLWGYKWLALITLLAVFEFLGVVHPRLRSVLVDAIVKPASEIFPLIVKHLTRTIEENPPTLFVATCYVVGFVGAVIVVGLYLVGLFTAGTAYDMANFFATYAFFLLVAGTLGQLVWIVRREE